MSGWTRNVACLFIAFLISLLVVEGKNNWRKKEKVIPAGRRLTEGHPSNKARGGRCATTDKRTEWMNEWMNVALRLKKEKKQDEKMDTYRPRRDLQDSKRLFAGLGVLTTLGGRAACHTFFPPSPISIYLWLSEFVFLFFFVLQEKSKQRQKEK